MIEKKKNSPPKKGGKTGRNPKIDPAVYRYTVRFNEVEHNRFLAMFEKSGVYARSVFLKEHLAMFEKSGVYARSVFLKEHFFGRPFKVLKVDKTLVEYCTRLSDFHAQFRAVGTNYNQVVKELRMHFSEKKQDTIELVKLSRQIVGLSEELKEWAAKNAVMETGLENDKNQG